MSGYKHIETAIARYIAGRYRSTVETGAGLNLHAACLLYRAGILRRCTDIILPITPFIIPYEWDDITRPRLSLYSDCECIYAIRPVDEMIAPLIRVAEVVMADLLIYHLGFEGTDRPAPVPGCEVPLHLYHQVKN
jgi:uncharacterized protein